MNGKLLRRIIREEIEKIEEAVALSRVKPLMQLNHVNKHRDEFFEKLSKLPNATFSKRKDRIYFPIGKSKVAMGRLEKEIVDTLSKYDYKVINYLKNIAETPKGQRVKMTKALARVGENDLLDFYSTRSKADIRDVSSGRLVCFSKHPYDLKGMSLGRSWEGSSCMASFTGERYIPVDIEKGTIVVYSIEPDDLNLSKPKGRVLLKQFVRDAYNPVIVYFAEQSSYGEISLGIRKFINGIVNKLQNVDIGKYRLTCGLYNDSTDVRLKTDDDVGGDDNEIQSLKMSGYSKVIRSSKGRIWVEQDMRISAQGLSDFPFDVYGVEGDLLIDNNKITHLKWFPKIITGTLSISNNRIKNWKFGPESVGTLYIVGNPINTFKGSPEIHGNEGLRAYIDISRTNITNFKGMWVASDLTCLIVAENMLRSLSFEGLPLGVKYGTILHSGIPMKNLVGIPQYLGKLSVHTKSAFGMEQCKTIERSEIHYTPDNLDDITFLISALVGIKLMRMLIKTPYAKEVEVAIEENLPMDKKERIFVEKIG
jgi:hypothetical protein